MKTIAREKQPNRIESWEVREEEETLQRMDQLP